MTKISKTIKRLRNEKGFTQDELAEKIPVTRQAVSSWETGRTQPDAQMLVKLSEIFGVSIEELIYGEKRNTTLESETRNYMSTATVMIAVLGSLLIAAGIGLIFTFGWKKLPFILKAVFSFVPMLCGQGAAMYVLKNKKDSTAFKEGASVLWGAGIIASIALINGIFLNENSSAYYDMYIRVKLNYGTCLFLDTVAVIPIMYIMNSVSPLPLIFYGALNWSVFYSNFPLPVFNTITSALVLISVILFTYLKKDKLKGVSFYISKWFSAGAILFLCCLLNFGYDDITVPCLLTGSIFLLSFDKSKSLLSPSAFTGYIAGFAVSIFTAVTLMWNSYSLEVLNKRNYKLFIILFLGAIIIASLILFRNNIKENKLKLIFIIGLSAVYLIHSADLFTLGALGEFGGLVLFGIVLLLGLMFILYGAKENMLLPINIGFAAIMAVILLFMIQSELDLMTNGVFMLFMGAVLLIVNLKVSKNKKGAERRLENEKQ